MKEITSKGYEFNNKLAMCARYCFYDENTDSIANLFDDILVEENKTAWESFNAEIMIALYWAIAKQDKYTVPLVGIDKTSFSTVPLDERYNAYQINNKLPMSYTLIKVDDTTVLLSGIDNSTKAGVYGRLDLVSNEIHTGSKKSDMTEVLGSKYSKLYFHYFGIDDE